MRAKSAGDVRADGEGRALAERELTRGPIERLSPQTTSEKTATSTN